MSMKVRGRYDGRAIVPDEPLDLPQDQPIEIEVTVITPELVSVEAKQAAWERLTSRPVHGAHISEEALRRENIYEDRA